ncbi:MAG: flavin reductase [Bacteroidales bacterium]|nr:flavin reductase [Bacteroidales bacterium]
MKTSHLLNIILSIALVIVTLMLVLHTPEKETEDTTSIEPTAQPEWHQIPTDSANINSFTLFQNAAALSVGKLGDMNSMTIGWGELGILWGSETHVVTVYVRKSRYTHHLMEENETFTVEAFAPEYADKLKYLGTASGRDENKMKGSGLTVKLMPNGAPAFEEGNLILECKKLYTIDYPTAQMDSNVVSRWYSKGEDFDNIHTAYVGEITAVWVK